MECLYHVFDEKNNNNKDKDSYIYNNICVNVTPF